MPLLNDDVENIGAVNDRFLRRRAGVKFISTPCLYFTKKATEYLSPDVFNTKKASRYVMLFPLFWRRERLQNLQNHRKSQNFNSL